MVEMDLIDQFSKKFPRIQNLNNFTQNLFEDLLPCTNDEVGTFHNHLYTYMEQQQTKKSTFPDPSMVQNDKTLT